MKRTQNRKFTKKTAAALLSGALILSGCLFSASAAAQSWTHTVSCSATGSTSFVFNANNTGNRSDTFGSYITIYNGKDHSAGTCYVNRGGQLTAKQPYYLQANSPSHPTVNFGKVANGASTHYYDNTYGGFSSSVTTSQQY